MVENSRMMGQQTVVLGHWTLWWTPLPAGLPMSSAPNLAFHLGLLHSPSSMSSFPGGTVGPVLILQRVGVRIELPLCPPWVSKRAKNLFKASEADCNVVFIVSQYLDAFPHVASAVVFKFHLYVLFVRFALWCLFPAFIVLYCSLVGPHIWKPQLALLIVMFLYCSSRVFH